MSGVEWNEEKERGNKGEYISSDPLGFKKVPKDLKESMWHEYLLYSNI